MKNYKNIIFSILAFLAFFHPANAQYTKAPPFAGFKSAAQITSLACTTRGTLVWDTTNLVYQNCTATGNPGTWAAVGGGGGGIAVGTTGSNGTNNRYLVTRSGAVQSGLMGDDGTTVSAAAPVSITGGTVTASTPPLTLTQTWNNAGVAFTGILSNITNTTSLSTSRLLDLQVGGATQFYVDRSGAIFPNGAVITGNATVSSGNTFNFSARTRILSPADGNILIANNANNDFGLLQMGGQTSAFPAWKRSGTFIQARLADDSAFASVAAGNISYTFSQSAVNINAAATDVATFTGLPAKYILRRVIVHTASAVPVTTATIDVRTAAAGGGTALVTAFALSALSTTSSFADATLATAATTTFQTSTTLYVRNVTAEGSAKTISVTIEIQPL